MKKLELININKTYELNIPVLKNISFFVDSGDFLVLLGPSGSGKSTILSIIAGFEPQNSGDVFIDGNNCNKKPCQDIKSESKRSNAKQIYNVDNAP